MTGKALQDFYSAVKVTLTPAQVQPATGAEQTFTVPGLRVGDLVSVTKPTTQANLGIGGVRVSAADTLAINFMNCGATGTITPTAGEVYTVTVLQLENLTLGTRVPSR